VNGFEYLLKLKAMKRFPIFLLLASLCALVQAPLPLCAQDSVSRKLEGHTDWVYSARFSPDGKYLASGGEDGLLLVHSWPQGELKARLAGYGAAVAALAYSPDGTVLAAGCADG